MTDRKVALPNIEAGIDPSAMTEEDLARWKETADRWLIRADLLHDGTFGVIAYSGGEVTGGHLSDKEQMVVSWTNPLFRKMVRLPEGHNLSELGYYGRLGLGHHDFGPHDVYRLGDGSSVLTNQRGELPHDGLPAVYGLRGAGPLENRDGSVSVDRLAFSADEARTVVAGMLRACEGLGEHGAETFATLATQHDGRTLAGLPA